MSIRKRTRPAPCEAFGLVITRSERTCTDDYASERRQPRDRRRRAPAPAASDLPASVYQAESLQAYELLLLCTNSAETRSEWLRKGKLPDWSIKPREAQAEAK